MTVPTHSIVLALPAALRDDGNRLAHAWGYQPEDGKTFSREVEDAQGNRYFGTRFWATESFRSLLGGARAGAVPEFDRAAFGLTDKRVKTVLSSLIFDERKREDIPDSGHSHWAAVLAERGLKEVEARAE